MTSRHRQSGVLALLVCASACASSASPDLGSPASPEPAGPSPIDAIDDSEATLAPIADDDVARTFQMLMQARPALTYGASCGFLTSDPPGRSAIAVLRASGRWDLVKRVLRGANPAGRLYAAEALLSRAGFERMSVHVFTSLTAEDARALRDLSRDESAVQACSGCIFWRGTVASELAQMCAR
jgi:hypothetical protein